MERLIPSRKVLARSQARQLALQALYAWQFSEEPLSQLVEYLLADPEMQEADKDYCHQLVLGVAQCSADLDQQLQLHMTRPLQGLDPVEKAILRLALFELLYCLEVPYKVVINEAIELAKDFGARDGHKFVNGVLDKIKVRKPSPEKS